MLRGLPVSWPTPIRSAFTLLLTLLLTLCPPLYAQESDEDFLQEQDVFFFGEEEVFSASRIVERAGMAPAAITVITARDIERLGFETLSEVLATIPGFYTEETETNVDIWNRGLANSFLVLLDGVPLAFQGDRESFPRKEDLSLAMIERIEIIRGPAAMLWGVNAFAGMIHLISKEGSRVEPFTGSLLLGSFGENGVRGSAAWVTPIADLYFAWSYRVTEEAPRRLTNAPVQFDLSDGSVTGRDDVVTENATDHYLDLYARARFWDRLTLSARWSEFADAFQISPFSHAPLSLRENGRRSTPLLFVQAQLRLPITSWVEEDSQVYLARYRDRSEIPLFPQGIVEGEPGGGRFEISGESFSLGAVQEFTLHLPQRVTWLLGGAYRGDFSSRAATVVAPEPQGGTGAISLTARSALFSGYLQSRVAITPKNLLTAGIRIDAPNDFAPSWNPRLAFVSEVCSGTFLKLLYGEATQTPDLFDLFNLSAGLVDGEVTGVEQNPDLEPEKLRSVEGIVQFDRWGFDLRANGYYTWIGEKIVQETGEDLVLRSYNAPETTRYAGFELEMAYRGVISPSIGYAFSHSLSASDTPGSPPTHQVYSGVEIAPTPAIHLSARLDWVGSRRVAGGGDLPPYPLGRLSLFIEPANSPLSFSMTVRNLFDTFHLSRSVTPIPGPPRSFTLTLRYRF